MPSDADAVIEEFTVEDAELVVMTLRNALDQRAVTRRIGGDLVTLNDEVDKRLLLIANHLAMEAGKVRMRAEQVST